MDKQSIKILLLVANPTDMTRLRLGAEIREIDNALRQADFRNRFLLEKHFAVRVTDLQSLLLRHKPDIVHFSGHGNSKSEILIEDGSGNSHPISADALSQLFAILGRDIRCVVLNACYSEIQAKAIAQHIDCVIGMSTAISDTSATSFSSTFYQALGYGKDIRTAFDLGCLQINLEKLGEQNTPKLLTRNDVNPSTVFLLTEGEHTSETMPSAQTHESSTDAIWALLKATFRDDATKFDQFCREYFSQEYGPNIPLYWKFELLIKHCQLNQQLNRLLIKIEAFDEHQYRKHTQAIKKSPKRRAATTHGSKHTRAEFSLPLPIEDFTPEMQAAAINAIAREFNIPAKEIKVMDVRQGSIKLTLELPSETLDELIAAYQTDRVMLLSNLGISYVMEMLDEPYIIEHINDLLVKGFTLEQLIDFCKQNYEGVLNELSSIGNIEVVASKLIEHAKQESQIPNLLTLVQKYNPTSYEKYRPYYNIPRKTAVKNRIEPILEKITRKELITAVIRGLMTSILGSLVLSIMDIFTTTYLPQNLIFSMLWNLFFAYASYYLGEMVGNQILAAVKNKDDPNLGKLAVACYALGFMTGYTYPLFILKLLELPMNKWLLIILSLCFFPLVVIVLIIGFMLSLFSFDGIFRLISLFIGSWSAYRRVKGYPGL